MPPFNGSGVFNRYTPGTPYVNNTTVDETVVNAEMADIATGLSNVICRDGQAPATANIPMGGFHLTGLGAQPFTAGTVSLPGIYLGTDTATGLYRIGSNNIGITINGTKLLDLSAALVGLTGILALNGPSTTNAVTGDIVLLNSKTLRSSNAANNTAVAMVFLDANDIINMGNSGNVGPAMPSIANASIPANAAKYAGCLLMDATNGGRFVFFDKAGARYYVTGTSF